MIDAKLQEPACETRGAGWHSGGSVPGSESVTESEGWQKVELALDLVLNGPSQPGIRRYGPEYREDVTCDNVIDQHQKNTPTAPTDQKVGGSSPSERADSLTSPPVTTRG